MAEHRLARLVQLASGKPVTSGRVKTRFQLYLAATVANLTLVLGKIGLSGSTGGGATGHHARPQCLSTLLSPVLRPISALSGSDNYGL